MTNLYTVLSDRFLQSPDKVAIQTPDTQWTYDQIEAGSAKLAHWLHQLNLEPQSRVVVQVEKSVQALLLYLATLRSGLVYVPLNTAYTASEVAYFLGNAKPAVFVCDPERLAELEPIATELGVAHVKTLDANGLGSLIDASVDAPETFENVATATDDLAAILYTSGTTGRSKGAMLTHGNLISNARTLHEYWQWQSDDVLLHMLPIFHIHGLFVACHGALHAGACMVWLPKLDIEQALRWLPESTMMMGVPTYYVRLLNEPRFSAQVVPKMRLFVSGSAPLLPETFRSFQEKSGHVILERYGMSETGMLTSNPYEQAVDYRRTAGTVGMPLPGVDVRVVDDAQNPCTEGEVGHVQVRGANVFKGYWEMPEKTQEEFTADGWFRTGDMGCWGGPGVDGEPVNAAYLSIVGRSKDLIITGGYNVYPRELELLIDTFEGVEESAVVGVPHDDFGEAVVAVVVMRPGVTLDVDAMQSELKKQLANYKVPKQICQVPSLPRNAMGKVQKNIIRDEMKACS